MLTAIGIHKTYRDGKKDLRVLKGIDLKAEKSESIAIAGPSGAGKSTLLHILGGIDRPTSGKVFLEGVDFYSLPDNERAWRRNRKLGFVFQFYHLLPEFNALENAMMPAIIGAQSSELTAHRPVERARELLIGVGLRERLTHRPSELSGGEQQRVAIARALINNPEVLLCDEPTGNLDSEMGKEILEIIFGLKKKYSTTVIIVTHDHKIARMADRVIEIRDGKII